MTSVKKENVFSISKKTIKYTLKTNLYHHYNFLFYHCDRLKHIT